MVVSIAILVPALHFFLQIAKNIEHNTCQLEGVSIFVWQARNRKVALQKYCTQQSADFFYNVKIIFRRQQKKCTATETCNYARKKIELQKNKYNNQPLCGGEHS